MKKTLPSFTTDDEAEKFVETADLSEYDLSGRFVRFERAPIELNSRHGERSEAISDSAEPRLDD